MSNGSWIDVNLFAEGKQGRDAQPCFAIHARTPREENCACKSLHCRDI